MMKLPLIPVSDGAGDVVEAGRDRSGRDDSQKG
jgi:hypothetical protein